VVVVGFAASFNFLALTLKVMPLGIVYAVWSGVGIVLIAAIGYLVFGQILDLAAVFGIGSIILGIVVIQLFSATATHS